MKPEAQVIAIAETQGWKRVADAKGWEDPRVWYHPKHSHAFVEQLPDYLNDLDAIHKVELTLTDLQHNQFRIHLLTICGNSARRAFSATAAERCEAILKTLNLWIPS